MPEQDNWKVDFRKLISCLDDKHQAIDLLKPLKGDFYIDGYEIEIFIENLLSSQARALKEQMKEKLELLRPSRIEDVIDESQNNTIDASLSAIESIEI